LQTTVVVLRGLYITYKKQREVSIYRAKSQLRYCVVGLLIYLFAAIDYLCNYGVEFYPPGIIFITISLTIITYAIVRHRLLDLSLAISLFFTRIIVYSTFLMIFILSHFVFTGNYLPNDKLYLFAGALILILSCEAYGFITKKVQNLSEVILVNKRRKIKNTIDSLNQSLEKSASIEELAKNIENFIEHILSVKLLGFYVKADLYSLDEIKGNYRNILNKDDIINFEQKFISKVAADRMFIEETEYLTDALKRTNSQIFIPFVAANELLGFALIANKRNFKTWYYEIFYLLINQIGILIDRIRIYQEILLQKQRFLEDKAESLRALAGSIAHELRNPLGAISLASNSAVEILKSKEIDDSEKIIKTIDYKSSIISSIKKANDIIDIILNDLGNKPISKDDFVYLSADQTLSKIIAEYGYQDTEQIK
jgi:K+-sensing histidine kinase KdpD